MGGISIWQLLIITATVILLSGTKKLSSIGSGLGASIGDFKKTMSDDEPKQDKTSQNADSTAEATADKQTDTSQEQVKTEDVKRHNKEQVQSVFDISFSELLLMFIIGLVVLGPQRLPVTVRTVAGWVHALRLLAATVRNKLTQKLRLQEFQDSPKKVRKASLTNLTPELKALMDGLRQATESMKCSYVANSSEKASDEARAIHNPMVKDNRTTHEGVTPAAAQTQASSPEQRLETAPEPVVKPAANAELKTVASSSLLSDKP